MRVLLFILIIAEICSIGVNGVWWIKKHRSTSGHHVRQSSSDSSTSGHDHVGQSSSSDSLDINLVPLDEWMLVRIPGDGNCLYHTLHAMLMGRLEAIGSYEGMREMRDRLAHLVDRESEISMEDMGSNVFEADLNTFHYEEISKKYKDLRLAIENEDVWGDLRAIKLFTYLLGQPVFMLYPETSIITEEEASLDWGRVMWKGHTSEYPIAQSYSMGPPFTLSYEKANGVLHYNLILRKHLYETFRDNYRWRWDEGIPLEHYMRQTGQHYTGPPEDRILQGWSTFLS